MDRRTWLLFALAGLFATIASFACAGANGDPAPAVQEAGADAAAPPCTDGATE